MQSSQSNRKPQKAPKSRMDKTKKDLMALSKDINGLKNPKRQKTKTVRVSELVASERLGVVGANSHPYLQAPPATNSFPASGSSTLVVDLAADNFLTPRLFKTSSQYQFWRFRSVKIRIIPTIGQFSTTQITGNLISAYLPDPGDALNVDLNYLEAQYHEVHYIGDAKNHVFSIPKSKMRGNGDWLATNGTGCVTDPRLTTFGTIVIGTYSNPSGYTGGIAEIHLDYAIEFKCPCTDVISNNGLNNSMYSKLYNSCDIVSTGSISGASSGTLVNLGPSPPLYFNFDVTNGLFLGNPGAIDANYFTTSTSGINCQPGAYLVHYNIPFQAATGFVTSVNVALVANSVSRNVYFKAYSNSVITSDTASGIVPFYTWANANASDVAATVVLLNITVYTSSGTAIVGGSNSLWGWGVTKIS